MARFKKLGITDLNNKMEYVRKNYYGQLYLAYAFEELDNIILSNFLKVDDYIILSSSAIDGILRAFCFAIKYLQPELPGHAHNYVISKSGTFIFELVDYYNKKNLK